MPYYGDAFPSERVKKEMMLNKFLAIGILIPLLVLIAPHAYARNLSDTQRYNDGYSNGSDAAATDRQNGIPFDSTCDPTNRYTSGGGHTTTYCNGWTDGYTSTYNGGSPRTVTPGVTGSSHEDFASECNAIQGILIQPCNQLVNPDGSLTVDGNKANTCIRNGIVLGLGGLLLTGGDIGSLPLIKSALQILSSRTGCDGVVNWNTLDLGQLGLLKRIFG
ncbi:MAG: hypothetical protein M3044_10165 [Thermoproteota archaeon]|nr:hypothetical protein [Thermoproteota archaeon]